MFLALLVMSSCAARVSGDLDVLCQRTLEIEASNFGALAEVESQKALDFIYEYLYVVDLSCGRVS